MMIPKERLLREELERQSLLYRSAISSLSKSYEKCTKIGVKDSYEDSELEMFDSLTTRFARASDILIQKILRLHDEIELEETGSIIDRINRAEKRGVITSGETFKEIRRVRNRIAHEYVIEDLVDLFREVLKYCPILINNLNDIENYSKKYLK